MHIGQSKSSLSCSTATIFISNSGLLDTSSILLEGRSDLRSEGHNAKSLHIWRSRKIIQSTVEKLRIRLLVLIKFWTTPLASASI